MKPHAAALQGAREVGFTVLSMSLSLIAVFIPILLMGGIVGRLFREFAVTLSVAILISLVISLTTTPMMCARLLRPAQARRPGRIAAWSARAWDAVNRGYRKSLAFALVHSVAVMLVLLVTVCLNVYLYVTIPKGFFPQQDTGRLTGGIQADQSISFQAMREKLTEFMRIVGADPAVENVVGFTGGAQRNSGFMFVALKPLSRAQRDRRPGHRATARQARARAGRQSLPSAGAGHPHRRPTGERAISVHAAGRRPHRTSCVGTEDPPGAVRPPRARRRQHRHAGQRTADLARHRPRCGGAARRLAAHDRHHAERPLRAAAGVDDLRAAQSVPRRDGGRAGVLAVARRRCRSIYVSTATGAQVPLSAFATYRTHEHAARRQSPGSVRGVDDLVQSARRTFRCRRPRARSRMRCCGSACRIPCAASFQGTARAFQASLDEPAVADPGGAGRGLHRAGRALRELRAPDHDPVDAAVGRRRRAAGADALPHRVHDHRDHRRDPADRHRQEERDHDDRLRARRRAQPRALDPRRDLRGLHCCAFGRS